MGVMRQKILEAWEWGLEKSIRIKWALLASGEFEGSREPPCTICKEDDQAAETCGCRATCLFCPLPDCSPKYDEWTEAMESLKPRPFRERANSRKPVKAAKAMLRELEKELAEVQSALKKG